MLISSTFIAIDSSAWTILDGMLDKVPGDFTAVTSPSNHTTNASGLRQAFLSVSGVQDVSVFRPLPSPQLRIGNASGTYPVGFDAYGIEPDHLPSFLRGIPVNGSLGLPRGSVALSTTLARFLRVGIGDLFSISNAEFENNTTQTFYENLTVAALITTPSNGFPYGFCIGYCGTGGTSLAVVNLEDVDWLQDRLDLTNHFSTSTYAQIWIDRVRFVNPYDVDGTELTLRRLVRKLEAAYPLFGNVGDNVSPVLGAFAQNLSSERLIFLLLSAPVFLLGLYVAAVGVELGYGNRRREVAILKTRGSSGRQAIGVLVAEAAIGGLVAAALGLLFGVLVAPPLEGVVSPGAGEGAGGRGIIISLGTVVTVAALSVLFMVAASYRASLRSARLPIVETLRFYAPGEATLRYRPWIDATLVTLGAATYAFAWLTQSAPGSFFTFLLGGVFFALLPAAPIFLIFGVTRLATRSTGRVYDWTAAASRPVARNLNHVVRRNLSRNPRRSANIAVIVALGLGFGLFAYGLLGSQQAYQVRTARAVVGGDLAVLGAPYTAAFEENLAALPEIATTTRFTTVAGLTSIGQPTVFALDSTSYFNVTRPDSWCFEGLTPGEAETVLAIPGDLLVTGRYFDEQALEMGQILTVSLTWHNATTNRDEGVTAQGTISGIVRSLPGLSNGEPLVPEAVFGSFATFRAVIENETRAGIVRTDGYLVNLRPGADWETAKADLESLANSDPLAVSPATVLAFQGIVQEQGSSPMTLAFLGFIRVEILFLAAILTAGLGIVLYAASLEREAELAAIAARGASRGQISGLLLGEGLSIVLIGVAVGAAIGFLASYLGTLFFLVGPPGTPPTLVPFFLVMPLEGWLLLLLAPLAMLGESALLGWRVARMDVARVLKLRGG